MNQLGASAQPWPLTECSRPIRRRWSPISRIKHRLTVTWHNLRLPDTHPFTLPRRDPERIDLAAVKTDLEFVMDQLARLPTRKEIWRAALIGMLTGACLVQALAFLFR